MGSQYCGLKLKNFPFNFKIWNKWLKTNNLMLLVFSNYFAIFDPPFWNLKKKMHAKKYIFKHTRDENLMIFHQINLLIMLNKKCVDFFRNIEFPVVFILSLTLDSENGDFFTQGYIFKYKYWF